MAGQSESEDVWDRGCGRDDLFVEGEGYGYEGFIPHEYHFGVFVYRLKGYGKLLEFLVLHEYGNVYGERRRAEDRDWLRRLILCPTGHIAY